jgi:hypothetical protein
MKRNTSSNIICRKAALFETLDPDTGLGYPDPHYMKLYSVTATLCIVVLLTELFCHFLGVKTHKM